MCGYASRAVSMFWRGIPAQVDGDRSKREGVHDASQPAPLQGRSRVGGAHDNRTPSNNQQEQKAGNIQLQRTTPTFQVLHHFESPLQARLRIIHGAFSCTTSSTFTSYT